MTTGSWQVGARNSTPFYQYRSWAGADFPKGLKRPKVMPDHEYTMYDATCAITKSVVWTQLRWQDPWESYESYQYASSGVMCRSFDSNDELKLLSKLADNIRGHSFNAVIALAESGEAVETVVNSLLALFGLLKGVVTANPEKVLRELGRILGQRAPIMPGPQKNPRVRPVKQWRNTSATSESSAVIARTPAVRLAFDRLQLGDVAGSWLALKYAWEPLIGDIYEAMKYVETLNSTRHMIFRTSHTIREQRNDGASGDLYELLADCSRSVAYKVTLSETPSMARNLGLLDPFSLAWEKLPLSFVLDWAWPIGSYLSNLSYFGGLKLTYVRTEFAKTTARLTRPRQDLSWMKIVGGNAISRTVTVSRTLGSVLPIPLPSPKEVSKIFNLAHLANGAALIWGGISSVRSVRNFT